MPIRVDGPCVIHCQGASDLRCQSRGIAVVLMYDSNAAIPGVTLHPLGDDERMIGGAFSQAIFPDKKVVSIPLDAADLLSAPPAAWESLDAIALDLPAMGQIDDERRSALLAAGVMLVTRAPTPPDHRWPWVSQGSLWVLRYSPAGPTGHLIDESAYAPTLSWPAGLPAQARRWIFSAGALLAIAAIALAIWPSRWAALRVVALAAICTVAIAIWQRSTNSTSRIGGDVVIRIDGCLQRDRWLYQRARRDGRFFTPWDGWTHPIFNSSRQQRAANLELDVNADGRLQFAWDAAAGQTIAFVHRTVTAGIPGPVNRSFGSPMEDLVKAVYLTPGLRVLGEQPPEPGRWASVVVADH